MQEEWPPVMIITVHSLNCDIGFKVNFEDRYRVILPEWCYYKLLAQDKEDVETRVVETGGGQILYVGSLKKGKYELSLSCPSGPHSAKTFIVIESLHRHAQPA